MADTIGLSDVSSEDTGKGKILKTGNLKRGYNMAKCKKGFKQVKGKCVLIKKRTLLEKINPFDKESRDRRESNRIRRQQEKSQIKSIERGEYWDSGGVKNPELNTSDSTRVRKQKIKELKKYHKSIGKK